MSGKMTVEQFYEAYEAEHPLPEDCTRHQWIEAMAAAERAYREYDPEGWAKRTIVGVDFGTSPALTIGEWERKYLGDK